MGGETDSYGDSYGAAEIQIGIWEKNDDCIGSLTRAVNALTAELWLKSWIVLYRSGHSCEWSCVNVLMCVTPPIIMGAQLRQFH